ncbi:phosphoglycerate mutase-like protein [Backusella circina FSU 941]|nr:phosphoglycerate mutase-like protein [Backusella circina FSU 941]
MSLSVTLVRHGNTDANNERWLQGQFDTCLNKTGLNQAKLCGERLKTESYDHIYCSDLYRCKQTAASILSHHPSLSIDYHEIWRERDFGQLSRKPLAFLSEEANRLNISVDELIGQNNGETEVVFCQRAIAAYTMILKDAKAKGYRSVLVVTHGGPLKYLSGYWMDQGFKVMDGLVVKPVAQGNTAVNQVILNENNQGTVVQFNSITHLKDHDMNQPPPPAV